MSIRNLTTQVPFAVEVVTSRKRFARKVDFLGTVIKFHAVDPKMMFGYENIIWKENFRIPVANKEKIIIDAVHIGHIPEEEIFDMIKISNAPLLKRYANLTGNEKIKNKITFRFQNTSNLCIQLLTFLNIKMTYKAKTGHHLKLFFAKRQTHYRC